MYGAIEEHADVVVPDNIVKKSNDNQHQQQQQEAVSLLNDYLADSLLLMYFLSLKVELGSELWFLVRRGIKL
jgi:hypothetical protein